MAEASDDVFAALLRFDTTVGPTLEWIWPLPSDPSLRAACAQQLPFICLHEGASSIRETVETDALLFTVAAGPRALFGASLMHSERHDEGSRGSRQRAVAILARYPAFDVLEFRARALALLCLDETSGASDEVRAVLASTRERCADPRDADYASSVPLAPLFRLGPARVVELLKIIALRGRVVFVSKDAALAARCALGVAALLPAHLSAGVAALTAHDVPRLGAASFAWAQKGLPLVLDSALSPALSFATAALALGDSALGPNGARPGGAPAKAAPHRGYVVGTCNSMLAQRLCEWSADLVIDVDAGTFRAGVRADADRCKAAAHKDARSAKLAQQLREMQPSADGDVQCAWVGSDGWARSLVQEWLLASLEDAANARLKAPPAAPEKRGAQTGARFSAFMAQTKQSLTGGKAPWLLLNDAALGKWVTATAQVPEAAPKQRVAEAPAAEGDDVVVSLAASRGGTYSGDFSAVGNEKVRHGLGKWISDDVKVVYQGGWANGKRCGRGALADVDGSRTFEGPWVDDVAHGECGELRLVKPAPRGDASDASDDIVEYKGAFSGGRFHGEGVLRLLRRRRPKESADEAEELVLQYSGEFYGGKYHGAGTMEKYNEAPAAARAWVRYVGEWDLGLRHGVGTCTFLDGAVHSGEWRSGVEDGPGSLLEARGGSTKIGTFRQGAFHGAGSLTNAEGDVYEGQFTGGDLDWREHVQWTVKFNDGRRYVGSLRGGVPGGRGVMRERDGHYYEGAFADGLRCGQGTLFSPGGEALQGEWRCDMFVGEINGGALEGGALEGGGFDGGAIDDSGFDDDAAQSSSSGGFFNEDDDDDDFGGEGEEFRGEFVGGRQENGRQDNGAQDASPDARLSPLPAAPVSGEVSTAPRRGTARVRYPNGDVYDGPFCGGLREGKGVFSEKLTGHVYNGEWRKGERHGEGTFKSGDGSFSYDGGWRRGKRGGRGSAHIRQSCSYVGDWRDGVFHGQGTLVDAARNAYEGEFDRGRKHGMGTQTYGETGQTYSGEWSDGQRSGTGHCVFKDGATYSGAWLHDAATGEGALVGADGSRHDGLFRRGRPHGWGESTSNGDKREGCWDEGRASEAEDWSIFFKDGRKYNGAVRAGMPHGRGTCKWPNGEAYNGAWANGKRHGRGFGVGPTGQVYDGEWFDDREAPNGASK
ncbi:hypothetical protein M885DRAFT_457040 [Pelagophyceae sp. CCMP2097]|nr:hypothetical protein M885DRAFT_457040 [Pelagophyceae sp. CCMP2097]